MRKFRATPIGTDIAPVDLPIEGEGWSTSISVAVTEPDGGWKAGANTSTPAAAYMQPRMDPIRSTLAIIVFRERGARCFNPPFVREPQNQRKLSHMFSVRTLHAVDIFYISIPPSPPNVYNY